METVKMSDNKEGLLVALAAGAGAVAAYLAESSAIPNEVKYPVIAVLASFSVGVLAYWKAKVNVNITDKIGGT
jgi:hypothetical protein